MYVHTTFLWPVKKSPDQVGMLEQEQSYLQIELVEQQEVTLKWHRDTLWASTTCNLEPKEGIKYVYAN